MTPKERDALIQSLMEAFDKKVGQLESVVAAHVHRDHNPNGYPNRPPRMVELSTDNDGMRYVDAGEVVAVVPRASVVPSPTLTVYLRGGSWVVVADTPVNRARVLR